LFINCLEYTKEIIDVQTEQSCKCASEFRICYFQLPNFNLNSGHSAISLRADGGELVDAEGEHLLLVLEF
jgi:hypothetical protein